jgi:hypothetical protein
MHTPVTKLGLTALTGLVVVSAAVSSVSATVIIFDDLGLPHESEISGDEYADQGVIFSPFQGQLVVGTASFPIFPEDPQCLTEIPFFESVIIADFEPAATEAGAWIDFGNVGFGVMIEAFDGPFATGNLLATASTTEEEFLGVEAEDIKSVRFMKVASDELRSFCIDHFTFELQPDEPDEEPMPAVSHRGALLLTLSILAVSTLLLLRRSSRA